MVQTCHIFVFVMCLQGETANEATKKNRQRKKKEKPERILAKKAATANNLSQDPTGSSHKER